MMRRAGLQGLSGRPKYRRVPNLPTASDLVDRRFYRNEPDQLWVTDITEHRTREGEVYCAVVLDVFSRRVVGWSIDSSPTALLVTSARYVWMAPIGRPGSTASLRVRLCSVCQREWAAMARVVVRDGGPDDLAAVQRTLFLALAWTPDPDMPPVDVLMRHPEVARYHRDWGRAGDAVVIAERGGEFIGAAFYRLFTVKDHGHGFVDEQTPELAIAIEDAHRGEGVGRNLMEALKRHARADGMSALSLSVKHDNPARHLYSKLGYEILTEDEASLRMLLRINHAS